MWCLDASFCGLDNQRAAFDVDTLQRRDDRKRHSSSKRAPLWTLKVFSERYCAQSGARAPYRESVYWVNAIGGDGVRQRPVVCVGIVIVKWRRGDCNTMLTIKDYDGT